MEREDLFEQIKFNLTSDQARYAFNQIVLLLKSLETKNLDLKEYVRDVENCIVQTVQALSPMKEKELPFEYYKRTKEIAQQFLVTRKYFNRLKDQ